MGDEFFRALLLRRTFSDLEKSLIDRSKQLYPLLGAKYNSSTHTWHFPSGAQIIFGYCASDSDVTQYQSFEAQYLGWDELTHFSEYQYTYLGSRVRTSRGQPLRVRAATNPGGIGHDFVLKRWSPWLDPQPADPPASSGDILHYENTVNGSQWCDAGTENAFGRAFLQASLSDNPAVGGLTGQYAATLRGLDPVERARLLDGDWHVRPAKGEYFQRSWFDEVGAVPAEGGLRMRFWDRAATVYNPRIKSHDPDWTVGVKLMRHRSGLFFIEDVIRFRGDPGTVEQRILAATKEDGPNCWVGLEQEPGGAGKFEIASYMKLLAGWPVKVYRPTGSKIVRAGPASAQAKARNIKFLKAPWNAEFFSELAAFPESSHDDQVDGLSGCVAALANTSVRVRRDLDNLPQY